MNATNLKKTITLLALVGSLMMFGCAQTGSSLKMDTPMDTLESSSQMMNESGMQESTGMMEESTMEESMKGNETGNGMKEKENTMMQDEKGMMK